MNNESAAIAIGLLSTLLIATPSKADVVTITPDDLISNHSWCFRSAGRVESILIIRRWTFQKGGTAFPDQMLLTSDELILNPREGFPNKRSVIFHVDLKSDNHVHFVFVGPSAYDVDFQFAISNDKTKLDIRRTETDWTSHAIMCPLTGSLPPIESLPPISNPPAGLSQPP